jgi:hypothetical protein
MDDFELEWYKANNAYKAPVDTFERDWQRSTNEYKTPSYNSWSQDDAIDRGDAPAYRAPTYSYDAPTYQAPSYDAPTYQAPSYDYGLPSFDYTPAPQYNTATMQTNAPWWQGPTSFASMGYGAPIGPDQSVGGSATMRAGSGPQNIAGQTFAGPNTVTTAPSQSGVAGGFGVDPRQYQLGNNNAPALLENAGTTGANRQLSNMAFDRAQENTSSRGGRSWVRDPENRDTVRLGIQGLGVLAGYQAQRDAGKLAKEQMGLQAQNMAAQREAYDREMGLRAEAQAMQKAAYEREMGLREEALASQRAVLGQNQQMAQRANQESVRSFDEARSLYNPQELGIRGMAQQRGTTQRSIEDTRRTLASRGLSAAAIDAEVRRQRLAGATNETTAYMRGLDTGRTAQAGALTNAKALGSTVPGLTYGAGPSAPSYVQGPGAPTFAPNYGGADFYARQGAENSKALRDLLESYANYPTLRAQEEARRDMQRESLT